MYSTWITGDSAVHIDEHELMQKARAQIHAMIRRGAPALSDYDDLLELVGRARDEASSRIAQDKPLPEWLDPQTAFTDQ